MFGALLYMTQGPATLRKLERSRALKYGARGEWRR